MWWITVNSIVRRRAILPSLITYMINTMGKVCVSCGGGVAEPKRPEGEDEKCENCAPTEEAAPEAPAGEAAPEGEAETEGDGEKAAE